MPEAAPGRTPASRADARTALADRLRALLAAMAPMQEKPMFGTVAFLLDDRLLACARRDGALLVRVAVEQHEALLRRPGASQAEMGAGRTMGPGWIDVAPSAIEDDGALSSWIDAALQHHRTSGSR